MKVIIAGSREGAAYGDVLDAIRLSQYDITEVVCGGAAGVDQLGEAWALDNKIPIKHFVVTDQDWKERGKGAGHLRNARMAVYADALIAVWDGKSPGTKNMIHQMKERGKLLFVYRI